MKSFGHGGDRRHRPMAIGDLRQLGRAESAPRPCSDEAAVLDHVVDAADGQDAGGDQQDLLHGLAQAGATVQTRRSATAT
jgi:hypothetical protein